MMLLLLGRVPCDAVYCYHCSVICPYVSVSVTTVSPAKTDELIELPFWNADSCGPKQCSRMRILRFFQISKNMTFYFFELTCQKVVKSR